jgi:hypothetical protein
MGLLKKRGGSQKQILWKKLNKALLQKSATPMKLHRYAKVGLKKII